MAPVYSARFCPARAGKRSGLSVKGRDPSHPSPSLPEDIDTRPFAKALHHPVTHGLLPHNALTADCCRVPVLGNGQWTKALLDTGSTASLLHPDLMPAGTQIQATDVQLTTVTGGKAPMLGRWEALIEIETQPANQSESLK